jgi:copper chaperone
MELAVKGMTCGHCEAAVRRAVAAVDATAEVQIKREAGSVTVRSAAEPETVLQAIRAEGYDAHPRA